MTKLQSVLNFLLNAVLSLRVKPILVRVIAKDDNTADNLARLLAILLGQSRVPTTVLDAKSNSVPPYMEGAVYFLTPSFKGDSLLTDPAFKVITIRLKTLRPWMGRLLSWFNLFSSARTELVLYERDLSEIGLLVASEHSNQQSSPNDFGPLTPTMSGRDVVSKINPDDIN